MNLLSDFMAALSDPRAFMGAAKERTDKVKQMGIEETGPGDKKVQLEEKKEGKDTHMYRAFQDNVQRRIPSISWMTSQWLNY